MNDLPKIGEPTGTDCLNCGDPVIRRNRVGPVPKYCSDECRNKWLDKIERDERRALRQNMFCKWCDKHIPDRGMLVRYCNKTCSKAAHHARRMADPVARERFRKNAREWKRRKKARDA